MSGPIIESAFKVTWETPVRVKVGDGFPETISGPEEGLHYLTYRWPVRSGYVYDQARLSCFHALKKQTSCQAARSAFVSAAIEAKMLV